MKSRPRDRNSQVPRYDDGNTYNVNVTLQKNARTLGVRETIAGTEINDSGRSPVSSQRMYIKQDNSRCQPTVVWCSHALEINNRVPIRHRRPSETRPFHYLWVEPPCSTRQQQPVRQHCHLEVETPVQRARGGRTWAVHDITLTLCLRLLAYTTWAYVTYIPFSDSSRFGEGDRTSVAAA